MTPIIGIVICGIENQRQFISYSYINAIEKSGGLPILIPVTSSTQLWTEYLSFCNGFLFCGGNDISPILFGEELLTEKGTTDLKTDIFHIEFMKLVLNSDLPVLGICRGMQVMNVALGGDIYQDLSLLPTSHINHSQLSQNRLDVSHKIHISNESLLYSLCGSEIWVNSFHHQCVKKLGHGLHASASATDNIIEAIEILSHPFALGVQWHPECMYDSDTIMQKLFFHFIEISKKHKILNSHR